MSSPLSQMHCGSTGQGFYSLFSVPTTNLVLYLQFTAGEWKHAVGVGGGGGEGRRLKEEGGRKKGGKH